MFVRIKKYVYICTVNRVYDEVQISKHDDIQHFDSVW